MIQAIPAQPYKEMAMTTGLKTKEVVEVVSISTPMGEKGLCITCSHAPTCVFMKASHRPTWYCEEFDEIENSPAGFRNAQAAIPQMPHSTNGNGNGNGVSAGLCFNCDVRTSCNYRQPGKAVYNCEEYQ
jgi:hypothetical protein